MIIALVILAVNVLVHAVVTHVRIFRLQRRVQGLVDLSKATGIRFDANEKMLQSLTWSVSQLSQQGTSDHYKLKDLTQALGLVQTPTSITKH